MARFGVYRLRDGQGHVLDCQSNLLSALTTRFVVPLQPRSDAPEAARRLNPIFEIEGQPFVMLTQFSASLETRELGAEVCSLQEQDTVIMNALDMLLTGY